MFWHHQENLSRFKTALKGAVTLFAFGSFADCMIKIFLRTDYYQWDAKVYYEAAQKALQGFDPYLPQGSYTGFVYPPLQLKVFEIFSSALTEGRFYYALWAAKLAFLIGLVALWRRYFCKHVPTELFYIFAWAGLGAPFKRDLTSGNVSVFESALLFSSFFLFARGRFFAFAFLVVAAATLKLTPAIFLLLLLLTPGKRQYAAFLSGCGAFAGYLLANYIFFPDFSRNFLHQALIRVSDERGADCPSVTIFLREMIEWTMRPEHLSLFAGALYLLWIAFVFWRSRTVYADLAQSKKSAEESRKQIALFSVLVYVLIMPRMKDYGYVIAIPSVLAMLPTFRKWCWPLAISAMLIPNIGRTPKHWPFLLSEIWVYYALLICGAVWWVWVERSHANERPSNA